MAMLAIRRRQAVSVVAIVVSALAGCAETPAGPDGSTTAPPSEPFRPAPTLETAIDCVANVQLATTSCAPRRMSLIGDNLYGGQNLNVRLAATNTSYSAATQIFQTDVTVQNLLLQKIGTRDSTTVSGIRVFFNDTEPPAAVTGGTGVISLANADGVETFTKSNQEYFFYPVILRSQETSPVKQWRFNVPTSVVSFTFTVFISTAVMPIFVFDMTVDGNRDIWRIGIDGSDMVRLTANTGNDEHATTAKGLVVWSTARHGNPELYRMPLAGGDSVRLTTTATQELQPSLSADATILAFTRANSGAPTKVFTGPNAVGIPGAAVATTGGDAGWIEASPMWGLNGILAFSSTKNGGSDLMQFIPPALPVDLYRNSAGNDVEPSWSPDGQYVAFASNMTLIPAGDTELYRLHVPTGALTRLTNRIGSDAEPTWLSDGRIVYTQFTFVPGVGSSAEFYWLDPAEAVPVSHHIPIKHPTTGLPLRTVRRPEAVLF